MKNINVLLLVVLLSSCAYTTEQINTPDYGMVKYKIDTDLISEIKKTYIDVVSSGCEEVKDELSQCLSDKDNLTKDNEKVNNVVEVEDKEEKVNVEENKPEVETKELTRYHHTTRGSSDGGTSLVLCKDQGRMFRECKSGDIDIPWHNTKDPRPHWWNMSEVSKAESVICTDHNGVKHEFPLPKKGFLRSKWAGTGESCKK